MRIYVLGTLALLGALLCVYVPSRFERVSRFEQFGAGFLADPVEDLTVFWGPRLGQTGRTDDRPTIEAVIHRLSPHFSNWTEPPTTRGIDWSITFRSEAHLRSVTVYFGENCAVCGNFTRAMRPEVIAEIRRLLLEKSIVRDILQR